MKIIAVNKSASFEYFIEEKYEAGIVLEGNEIKSLRAGNVNMNDCFCFVRGNEVNIKNMHIEYKTLLNELPMYCLHKIDNGCNEKLKKERTIAWYMLYKLLLVYHNIDLTKCNIYENKNGKPYINDIFFNNS